MSTTPAMAPSSVPVAHVLAALPERRQAEAEELIAMMASVTGEEAVVWAGKILGFGTYRYRYETGREGIAPLVGFAPTPRHHTIYLVGDYQDRYPRLLAELPVDPEARRGAPRFSKACLYVPRLDAVRPEVLRKLVERTARVSRGVDVSGS